VSAWATTRDADGVEDGVGVAALVAVPINVVVAAAPAVCEAQAAAVCDDVGEASTVAVPDGTGAPDAVAVAGPLGLPPRVSLLLGGGVTDAVPVSVVVPQRVAATCADALGEAL
jgi:hypothetical protein